MNSEKMASLGRLFGAEAPDWLQLPLTAQTKLVELVSEEDFCSSTLEFRHQHVDVFVCVCVCVWLVSTPFYLNYLWCPTSLRHIPHKYTFLADLQL